MQKSVRQILEETLSKIAEENTSVELGERGTYVGASDVPYCLLKTVLNKTYGQGDFSVEQQLIFRRGHLLERILFDSLIKHDDYIDLDILYKDIKKNNDIFPYDKFNDTVLDLIKKENKNAFLNNYEVRHPDNKNILSHNDFTIWDNDGINIVEMKTSDVKWGPHDGWILQNIFQQGLVRLNHPNENVYGEIFIFDVKKGEVGEFKVDFDQNIFDGLVEKANKILNYMNDFNAGNLDLSTIDVEPSFLCSFCAHKGICKVYQENNDYIPNDLNTLISDYISVSDQISILKKKQDTLKDNISQYGSFSMLTPDGKKVENKLIMANSPDTKIMIAENPELAEKYKVEKKYWKLTIK